MKTIAAVILFLSCSIFPQKVYYAEITEEIDLGLAPYVKRVVSEAEENNASAIIFKINTFGGRVDAATQIKDAILASKVKTIAFINNRAVSAGALISLACKTIIIAPGSTIGAATVVDQAGEKVGEKYQSYMRSEMRSTAEKNGRRTDIAQGMVDERIIIDGLVDSTQLVSLTTAEALKYNIADYEASNIEDALAKAGLKDAEIVKVYSNWAEDVVRFLNNPIISSILLMVGFFGLMAEVKTPGWGLPGTMGIASLLLFFGSSYILELATIVEIILFVLGVALLALEVFIIPGFGFAGIAGIILIVASLFLSLLGVDPFLDMELLSVAILQITGGLLAAVALLFLLAKFLPQSRRFNTLVLANEERADLGFVSYPSEKELIGKQGKALTNLRPSGSAEIEGERYDVVAEWDYIEAGKPVKVLKVEGIKVVVKEIKGE